MKKSNRNYRKEYDNYHSKPEQRKRNAGRLRARRLMVKKGKVKAFDKKDVNHKDKDPTNNDLSNLSVTTQKYNRTEPRLRDEEAPVNATGSAIAGTSGTPGEVATLLFKRKKKKKKKKLLPVEALGEGKNMKQFHDLWDDDKTPEEIAKIMKLDLATVKKLMEASEAETSVEVPAAIIPDSTFASMPVFKVNNADFAKCKFGKSKFARWAKHIDTDSKMGKRIYNYAKKNPTKSIIVQHEKSGYMLYLRKYSKSDGSKSGIMVRKGEK